MAGKQQRRSSTSLGDRLDDLKDTINQNHIETSNRLTALETKFGNIPERVERLEIGRNKLIGAWSVLSALISGFLTYLGLKH